LILQAIKISAVNPVRVDLGSVEFVVLKTLVVFHLKPVEMQIVVVVSYSLGNRYNIEWKYWEQELTTKGLMQKIIFVQKYA